MNRREKLEDAEIFFDYIAEYGIYQVSRMTTPRTMATE